MGFAQWLSDWRWAANMKRARAHRRKLMFSARNRFDAALRPELDGGVVIAYPDAFYHTNIDDLLRAIVAGTPVPNGQSEKQEL